MERKPVLPCSGCGVRVRAMTRAEVDIARRGRAYCSEACKREYLRRVASETMARTNRAHASARMKANNPMARTESRAKMSATLRRIGHKPCVRGGNGHGPTLPETALGAALGWKIGVVVRTGHCPSGGTGFPNHYKLDVANEAIRVGVEIDGFSHGILARKAQDAKKDQFLVGLGWTVLRMTNAEVLADPAAAAARVLSTISALTKRTPTSRPGS